MNAPKGKLIAVGGAEDKGTDLETGHIERNKLKFFELGILRRIVREAHGNENARIEIITTASTIPEEIGDKYLEAFAKLHCCNVGHISIRDRKDAATPEFI